MNAEADSYLVYLVSHLPHSEKVALVCRCARIVVKLQNSMSLPIGLGKVAALEEVIRLAEESLTESSYLAELRCSLYSLRNIAFGSPTKGTFPSETVLFHVARAVYAAGLTALTSFDVDAQNALEAAFAAVQTAESKPAEDSLWEELHRARKATLETPRSRLKMLCPTAKMTEAIA